ncbi:MAG: outer membrane protein assembly factor BamB, partial [Methyloprofundus sp.]|nr:outer membrane protein assembly factor BamB [Methyloprofundus sp.]
SVNLLPAIIDDAIFAADRKGLVEARNINTGDLIWEQETELELSGGIGQGYETVLLGSSDGEVISLNSKTGEIKWKARVSSEILAMPVVGYGLVIVRTVDGRITALDELTGESVWSFERNVPALSIRGTGVPLVVSDSVIAGYANGKLLALNLKNGKNLWETTLVIPRGRSEIERLVDLDTDPIEVDDVIYIASYQGGVSSILAVDGDVLWTNSDISSHSGLSYDWRYLYLTDSVSDVWQLDQRSGGSLWKQEALHQRRLTAPVAYQNYVVVADFEGYVHWLADDDGRQLGRVQVCDAEILAKPIVDNDIIYIYASDGTLAALNVKSAATDQ